MKKVLRNIMIVTVSCLVMFACKKKDDDNPTGGSGGSRTDLLVNSWKLTNAQLPPPLDTFDIWSLIDSCEKDDIITFERNGTGTYSNGIIKCDSNEMDTESLTWMWTNNEASLTITRSDTVFIADDIKFSGNTMTGIGTRTYLGFPFTGKLTFTKQ